MTMGVTRIVNYLALIAICSIFLHQETMCNEQFSHCGQNLPVLDSGNISSPSYPNTYPPSIQCEWVINVPGGKGIMVEMLYFDTGDVEGRGDVLYCFDFPLSTDSKGGTSWQFDGVKPTGETFSTRRNKLWLIFQSDDENGQGQGFYLIFRSFDLNLCPDPGILVNGQIDNSGSFSVGAKVNFSCDEGFILHGKQQITCVLDSNDIPHWSGKLPSCWIPCLADRSSPGVRLYYRVPNDVHVIISPNYPNSFDNNELCTWEIDLSPRKEANITMQDFKLGNNNESYLELWDGSWSDLYSLDKHGTVQLLGNFTGQSFPDYVLSSGNKVAIKFTSGKNGKESDRHFKLIYKPASLAETNTTEYLSTPRLSTQQTTTMSTSLGCTKPPVPENMYFLPSGEDFNTGDTVSYKCNSGFFLSIQHFEHLENRCMQDKHWETSDLKNLPRCVATCRYWDTEMQTPSQVIYTNISGIIYSPNYPMQMPEGLCAYAILLQAGQVCTLSFKELSLGPETLIDIYETSNKTVRGQKIKSFNFDDVDTVVTSTKHIINIVINKTISVAGGKFVMEYQGFLSEFCEDPGDIPYGKKLNSSNDFQVGSSVWYRCDEFFATIGVSVMKCLHQQNSNKWNASVPSCIGKCGGYITSGNGTVVSPNYPNTYSINKECTWGIVAPISEMKFIVTIPVLSISQSDTLVLSDGHQNIDVQATCASNCSSLRLVTFSNFFNLSFKSGLQPKPDGNFQIHFEAFDSTYCAAPTPPQNGIAIGDDYSIEAVITYKCNPPYDLFGAQASTCKQEQSTELGWSNPPPNCIVLDCISMNGRTIPRPAELQVGAITNLGYPSRLIKGLQDCKWQISAQQGDHIMIHFRYFDLPEYDNVGDANFVDIYDGTDDNKNLISRFSNGPDAVIVNVSSTGRQLMVHYKSADHDQNGHHGFYMEYSAVFAPNSTILTTKPTGKPPFTIPGSSLSASPSTPSSKPESTKPIVTSSERSTTEKIATGEPVKSSSEPRTVTTTISTTIMSQKTSSMVLPSSSRSSSTPTPNRKTTIKLRPVITGGDWNTIGRPSIEGQTSNVGPIAAGIVVPAILIIGALCGLYFWYRKKYPVRMIFGRRFETHQNPVYNNQSPPSSSTLTLVRDPTLRSAVPNGTSNGNTDQARTMEGEINVAFTLDDMDESKENGKVTNGEITTPVNQ